MLRRTVVVILAVALAVSTSVCAFAAAQAAVKPPDVTIQLISMTRITTGLSFSGSTAKATVVAEPKSGIAIDYVKFNVKLMKVGSSTPVKTWNETAYISQGKFIFSDSVSVSSSGTYYVEATTNSYYNNSLIEQIVTTSANVVF